MTKGLHLTGPDATPATDWEGALLLVTCLQAQLRGNMPRDLVANLIDELRHVCRVAAGEQDV